MYWSVLKHRERQSTYAPDFWKSLVREEDVQKMTLDGVTRMVSCLLTKMKHGFLKHQVIISCSILAEVDERILLKRNQFITFFNALMPSQANLGGRQKM